MPDEEDPVFKKPKSYGIENLDAPGEPNRDEMPPSEPVPGTGREARLEHQRRHHKEDQSAPDLEFKDRVEREEEEEARGEVGETEADLNP